MLRALEKEPEQRYQQASEIKTRVETILTTRPQESATGSAGVMSPDDAAINQAQRQVEGPAIGLLVMGPINCITIPMYVFFISGSLLPVDIKNPSPPPPIIQTLAVLAVFILIVIAPGIFTIFAALKMMRLKAYRLAVDASILTIIASPAFFFIGLPIGIWALVVLSQREVRAAFAKNRNANGSASGPRQVDSQHTDTPSSSTSKASGAPGQFGTPKRPWVVSEIARGFLAHDGSREVVIWEARRMVRDLECSHTLFPDGDCFLHPDPGSSELDHCRECLDDRSSVLSTVVERTGKVHVFD